LTLFLFLFKLFDKYSILMEKDKLKLIVRNLRLLVDALESEIYSDVKSYTSKLEETLPPLPDYDEVFEDDE